MQWRGGGGQRLAQPLPFEASDQGDAEQGLQQPFQLWMLLIDCLVHRAVLRTADSPPSAVGTGGGSKTDHPVTMGCAPVPVL